jgi:8-oxo-dGTP diphosphatase
MPHTYDYPRPALTVDAVIVAKEAAVPQLLLIQRKIDPFKDAWALPGGFVNENESLDVAAARELEEETSVSPKDVNLVQVGTFGDKGRDPRGWTVTVAYACVVPTT